MKRTYLRPRSRRQAKAQRELAALIPEIRRRAVGRCEARFSPYCMGGGSVPHHVLKRSHSRYRHDPALIAWVCAPCNSAIEDEPLRARALGLVIESWEPGAFMRWAHDTGHSEDGARRAFEAAARQAVVLGVSFESIFDILRKAHADTGELLGFVDVL